MRDGGRFTTATVFSSAMGCAQPAGVAQMTHKVGLMPVVTPPATLVTVSRQPVNVPPSAGTPPPASTMGRDELTFGLLGVDVVAAPAAADGLLSCRADRVDRGLRAVREVGGGRKRRHRYRPERAGGAR